MGEIRHLENQHDVIFFCQGWSDLDKMSETAVIGRNRNQVYNSYMEDVWTNSMACQNQSHPPHCRVLPLGEFNVMILELRVTLQRAIIPFPYIKFVFHYILFLFCF